MRINYVQLKKKVWLLRKPGALESLTKNELGEKKMVLI